MLFLAMVVEEKLQPDEEEAASERVTRSWLLASLVIGELLALAVIAGGLSPSKGVGGLVAMSMLLAAFLIALPVIGRELQEGRSRRERLGTALRGGGDRGRAVDDRGHAGVLTKTRPKPETQGASRLVSVCAVAAVRRFR